MFHEIKILIFVLLFVTVKSDDETPLEKKAKEDLELTQKIVENFSPWFNYNLVSNLTTEICANFISGKPWNTTFTTSLIQPWTFLPSIYRFASAVQNASLNAAITELNSKFSPHGALYLTDFVVQNYENFYRLIEPVEHEINETLNSDRNVTACAEGVHKAKDEFSKDFIKRFVEFIREYYTIAECQSLYSILNPTIINFDLFEFTRENCTGTDPSPANLTALASQYGISASAAAPATVAAVAPVTVAAVTTVHPNATVAGAQVTVHPNATLAGATAAHNITVATVAAIGVGAGGNVTVAGAVTTPTTTTGKPVLKKV